MSRGIPDSFDSTASLIERVQPDFPVLCIRPTVIRAAARRFVELFPGTVLYALKCNPHPFVLEALVGAGIRHYDTASLPEIAQVREACPEAGVYFMHPVKDRAAIRSAYHRYAVRHFVVDHPDELEKILQEVEGRDLVIFVRLKTPESSSVLYHLAAKFGAEPAEAADLVRAAVRHGCRTGLTFHVGSQCLEPKAYRRALELVGEVVERSGVRPQCVDVGGGFPHPYHQLDVAPLEDFMTEIADGLAALRLPPEVEILAEPGRALVAGGCSVVTRIRLRKDDQLYINDGVYGSFSELIDSEQELPARVFAGSGAPRIAPPREFVIHGPTCDSMDVLSSGLVLPGDVAEGDWIEVDQIGAYSNALATRFNGFSLEAFARVADDPPATTLAASFSES
jgi:ornithine decarboxylase